MLKKILLLICWVSFSCAGQPHDKYEKIVWGMFAAPPALWFGSNVLKYQAKKQSFPYNNMTPEQLEQWKKRLKKTKKISKNVTFVEIGLAVTAGYLGARSLDRFIFGVDKTLPAWRRRF